MAHAKKSWEKKITPENAAKAFIGAAYLDEILTTIWALNSLYVHAPKGAQALCREIAQHKLPLPKIGLIESGALAHFPELKAEANNPPHGTATAQFLKRFQPETSLSPGQINFPLPISEKKQQHLKDVGFSIVTYS